MDKRGVTSVFVYGVDNVLIRVADPNFIGCFVEGNYDCALKVVPKTSPEEAVGVICLSDDVPRVVEYSELDKESANLRNPITNTLLFNGANICVHCFTVSFLHQIADIELPFHVAKKKIPCVDENGVTQTPPHINGWKLEMFIFDSFPYSKKTLAFEVVRNEEFSPLKNQFGVDSPDTCKLHLSQLHKQFIKNAGGFFNSEDTANELCEVSPLISYAGEGLENLVQGKIFTLPLHLN